MLIFGCEYLDHTELVTRGRTKLRSLLTQPLNRVFLMADVREINAGLGSAPPTLGAATPYN